MNQVVQGPMAQHPTRQGLTLDTRHMEGGGRNGRRKFDFVQFRFENQNTAHHYSREDERDKSGQVQVGHAYKGFYTFYISSKILKFYQKDIFS